MEKTFYGKPKIQKVDRHRAFIPSKARQLIGGNLVYLVYINEDLIRCYTPEAYEKTKDDMLQRSRDDSERQAYFLGQICRIDDSGRIMLNAKMSELEKVIFAPNGDVIDIYNPKQFHYKHII